MTITSYAQNFEDVILWRAFRDVPAGFYVDVGANDPDEDSVTKLFYERGWSGINIEPELEFWQRLCEARPRDTNLAVAVGESKGSLQFYSVPVRGLSTLDEAIATAYRASGLEVISHEVEVETLSALLVRHASNRPIHFLKIDVEGAEASVLKGLDLRTWRPWVLVVEATRPNSTEENYALWEPSLLANGYRFAYFDGLNRFYVAEEQESLRQKFTTPPNVLDDFVIDRMVTAGRHIERDHLKPAVDRLTEQVAHHEQRLVESRHNQARLEAELAQKTAELARVQANLDAVSRSTQWRLNADRALADAKRMHARLENQIELFSADLERMAVEKSALLARLDAIYASTSWRITAPMRVAMQAMRALARPKSSVKSGLKIVIRKAVPIVLDQVWLRPVLRQIATRFPGPWDWLMRRIRGVITETPAVPVMPRLSEDALLFKAALTKRLAGKRDMAGGSF
ncbi:FkbM family methyltransferase [Cupriavidus necator]|uniref:FkbM family methyltransferase n=1 Tax=Cupriavidus necator TaxID=106590 RepID=UPI0039C377E7